MLINDILLVTRNYQGICEENFLTTVDEFVDEYCQDEEPVYAEELKKILSFAKPYEWPHTFYSHPNVSFDMRLCQGQEDLLNFLSGKHNDSVESMENRNPGYSYDYWYWENRADFFSEKAIEIVQQHIKTSLDRNSDFAENLFNSMPDFPASSKVPIEHHRPLDEVISLALQNKTTASRPIDSTPTIEL